MDIRLALMTGIDIPVPVCQLAIHQPSIREISMIGEKDFFIAAQCLCLNKTMYIEDESLLKDTSNFQIFMTVMSEKSEAEKKENVSKLLNVLFPNYKTLWTPRSILLNSPQGNVTIDENNFEILQEIFQEIFCLSARGEQAFNPANDAAKKIADKLMRARQKVAAQKQDGNGSVFSQYVSSLSVGLHMSLKDILDLTIYQLYDLIERFSLFTNWDIHVRASLAGAKQDSQPDNWMKNIH